LYVKNCIKINGISINGCIRKITIAKIIILIQLLIDWLSGRSLFLEKILNIIDQLLILHDNLMIIEPPFHIPLLNPLLGIDLIHTKYSYQGGIAQPITEQFNQINGGSGLLNNVQILLNLDLLNTFHFAPTPNLKPGHIRNDLKPDILPVHKPGKLIEPGLHLFGGKEPQYLEPRVFVLELPVNASVALVLRVVIDPQQEGLFVAEEGLHLGQEDVFAGWVL